MPMPRLFIITVFIFSGICNSYCQSKDELVANIRKLYLEINDDHSLKKVILQNENFLPDATDGGCSLTGYFKENKICKMDVWVGLSYGVQQFHYYFENRKLIFVYETEENFPPVGNQGTLDYTKLKLAFEGRYYFSDGKVIDIKNKGQHRFGEEPDLIKQMVDDANSYSKLLQSHLIK